MSCGLVWRGLQQQQEMGVWGGGGEKLWSQLCTGVTYLTITVSLSQPDPPGKTTQKKEKKKNRALPAILTTILEPTPSSSASNF